MGIGAAIVLIALGAILAFAVDVTVSGLDLVVIGWILMAAGVIGLLVDLIVFAPRRRTTVSERRAADPRATVVEERRTYDA